MNFAIDAYHLTPDKLERFDFVYERKPTFAAMIEDSAAAWRYRFRSIYKTEQECRWAFLQSVCSENKPLFSPKEMREVPSVARYLCLCTERRVACLDANEDSTMTGGCV